MTKKKKIIYWVITIWLAFGMAFTGVIQTIQIKDEVDMICLHLGYPTYFLTLIGIWKLLGAVALLIPKCPLLKEWAYAGFFFVMSGAVFSHLAVRDKATDFIGPVLLLILTFLSWYFRPESKKFSTPKK